jgi:hypothetical protein
VSRALLLLLFACSGVAGGSPSGAVPFPHAAGYEAARAHGREAIAAGAAACEGCHRLDASGAATCASCHPAYPHGEGWLAGSAHGNDLSGVAGAAGRDTCATCHEVSGLAAAEVAACTGCHPAYPHPAGFAAAGQHGVPTLTRGSAAATCGPCHGRALEGGENAAGTVVAPGCSTCHADYPHPEGWSDAVRHGAAALSTSAGCDGCHGAAGEGGTAGVACARCHANYPHPADWADAHLATVAITGEGVCVGCHAAGEGTSVMPARCASRCHGGGP